MKHCLFILLCCSLLAACGDDTHNKKRPAAEEQQKEITGLDRLSSKPASVVSDFDDLYTQGQEDTLCNIIAAFEKESTMEICVLTLDTSYTNEYSIAEFSTKLFNKWGIGKKEKNNGILITIFSGHQQMFIANGTGTETILSDSTTARFIDKAFIPSFKVGDYYKGTYTGLNELIAYLRPRASKIK